MEGKVLALPYTGFLRTLKDPSVMKPLYFRCVLFSEYVQLADRWDSINSTEEGHVNHRHSFIPHGLGVIHNIHRNQSHHNDKCVGPCVNLHYPLGRTSNGEAVIITALPDA